MVPAEENCPAHVRGENSRQAIRMQQARRNPFRWCHAVNVKRTFCWSSAADAALFWFTSTHPLACLRVLASARVEATTARAKHAGGLVPHCRGPPQSRQQCGGSHLGHPGCELIGGSSRRKLPCPRARGKLPASNTDAAGAPEPIPVVSCSYALPESSLRGAA